ERIVVGGQPSYLMEMDVLTYAMTEYTSGEDQTGFRSVAFSDGGDLVAVGVTDSSVRVYQRGNPEPLRLYGHEWPIQDVLFMGDKFVLSGDPQTIKLWNIDEEREIRTLIDTSTGEHGS